MLDSIRRHPFWQLTISFWPKAVEAGVRPFIVSGYDPIPAGGYSPRTIEFDNPPSRQDFLQVVRQTPWMSVWEEDLLPVIAKNDWPMIDFTVKGSTVRLKDEQGREVGELRVWKQELYRNKGYWTAPVAVDELDKAIGRIRGAERISAATKLLREKKNWLREQFSLRGLDDEKSRINLMRQLLFEAGLQKTKPKISKS